MSSAANLPRLPEEIWSNVIALATHVPFALDTGPPNAFTYPGQWEEKQIQDAILASMVIKSQLGLVCKQWNKLALRHLYEIIDIRDVRTITRLAQTFKAYDATSSPSSHVLGKWTKRINIRKWSDDNVVWEGLKILLRSFSSLEIIVANDMAEWPNSSFMHPFLSYLPKFLSSRNILKLDFASYSDRGLLEHLSLIFNMQANLRFLRINFFNDLTSVSALILANVEFMDITPTMLDDLIHVNTFQKTTHMNLVGTQRLRFVKEMAPTDCSHRLISLEVSALESRAKPFFSIIHDVKVFPNLQELIISFGSDIYTIELPSKHFRVPPIKKLGLRVAAVASSKGFFQKLCPMISAIVRKSRTIEVVRLISRIPAKDLIDVPGRPHTSVMRQTSTELFSTYAVRFENSEGHLFHEEIDGPTFYLESIQHEE